jgi:hypothetical protein
MDSKIMVAGFLKKVMNPKVLPMLMDVMFTDYLKQKGM